MKIDDGNCSGVVGGGCAVDVDVVVVCVVVSCVVVGVVVSKTGV